MVSEARVETPSGASESVVASINALAASACQPIVHTVGPSPELVALIIEHDDLDSAIAALSQASTSNDQCVVRLKKRKLLLRDRILAKAASQCGTGAY